MIELQPFKESDFSKLIAEIPDARSLLQWAGPKYTYPLDATQLSDTLANTIGEKPSFQVFKANRSGISEAVGHIQLMDIDYNAASCVLGRVLIFQKYRGNGFGKLMVQAAVKFAAEFQFNKGARQFQNESWNVIKMRLSKNSWLHRNGANDSIEMANIIRNYNVR